MVKKLPDSEIVKAEEFIKMFNKDIFNWERIEENENFIVEYDKDKMMYRVSYFEDNHYCDEIVFNAPQCPIGCAGTLSKYDLI